MAQLLAVTEQLIEMMKASPQQFAPGEKFADLDYELMDLVRGRTSNRTDCPTHLLPTADQDALIAAYREHVVGHRLAVYVTKVNLGELSGAARSSKVPYGSVIGAGGVGGVGGVGGGGKDHWVDLQRAAMDLQRSALLQQERVQMETGRLLHTPGSF